MRHQEARFGLASSALGLTLLLALAGCAATLSPHPSPAPASTAAAGTTSPVVTTAPQREWAEAILYFVVLDRFADGDPRNNRNVQPGDKGAFHGGDLAGLIQQLDGLADLGVTALWITPVVKNIDGFVTGAGFPDWGYHGYWADDFNKIDPRFGTEEELKQLVDGAHARGIKVLLDVVYNHAGYNSRYLRDGRTRGWLRTEELGTCGQDDLTSCVAGLPDFKTEQPDIADYLLDAHLALAKRVGLDGFRLDTVKHVDHPFWQLHRARTRAEVAADFFLLGEVWGGDAQTLDPWFSGDEMDAGFDFGFQGSALAFVQGRGRAVAFDRYLQSREKVRDGYLLSHFLSSHDVPGALYQLKGDRSLFRLAAILQLMTSGIPMIYYGEEVGRPGGDWPENRSDMPWGQLDVLPGKGLPRDEALRMDYKKLIALRRAHPAIWNGEHQGLMAEGDVLAFERRSEAHGSVVVVVNRGKQPAQARFARPPRWEGAAVNDRWGGAPVTPSDEGFLEVTVPPLDAAILVADEGQATSSR